MSRRGLLPTTSAFWRIVVWCSFAQTAAALAVGPAYTAGEHAHPCLKARAGGHRLAAHGEFFFRLGTPTGEDLGGDVNGTRRQAALEKAAHGLQSFTNLFQLTPVSEPDDPLTALCSPILGRKAARVASVVDELMRTMFSGSEESQRIVLEGASDGFVAATRLFSRGVPSWYDALMSGWPVFKMSWMLDEQLRHKQWPNRHYMMLSMPTEPRCKEVSDWHEYSVILSAEGRVSQLGDVLREFGMSGVRNSTMELLLHDLLRTRVLCPMAAAVALASIADALQCHLHRPESCGMQNLLRMIVEAIQWHAIASVSGEYDAHDVEVSDETTSLRTWDILQSKWPLLRFMARVQVPQIVPGVRAGELCVEGKGTRLHAMAWLVGDHIEGELLGSDLDQAWQDFQVQYQAINTGKAIAALLGDSDGAQLAFVNADHEREDVIKEQLQGWLNSLWRFVPNLERPVVVSWSSREAEMGGLNWAETFAKKVFGHTAGVELVEDLYCADIFIYRATLPLNFGGVLVYVDGETRPGESLASHDRLLSEYPLSLVVGPVSAGNATSASSHIMVPYASTSFASRSRHTPLDLLLTSRSPPDLSGKPHLAAYMAYNCVQHREQFFTLLRDAADKRAMGEVHALSTCGRPNTTEEEANITREAIKKERYSTSYFDDAVEKYLAYKFAIVFENRMSENYVTEKIVNAFLAGAIPIYWGSPLVLEIFNPAAFVYVNNYPSFEAVVRAVLAIDASPELYRAMATAPILRNTSFAKSLFSWDANIAAEWFPGEEREQTLKSKITSMALSLHKAGQQQEAMDVGELHTLNLSPQELRTLRFAPHFAKVHNFES
mmetsp:Transcript_69689/g.167279  ORF Transcript_69689/g.167279 Transcript_69689/m.167279 type:complete len:834 (-) Transcript_69689:53-2554(-)